MWSSRNLAIVAFRMEANMPALDVQVVCDHYCKQVKTSGQRGLNFAVQTLSKTVLCNFHRISFPHSSLAMPLQECCGDSHCLSNHHH
jgi:hypothetical protein